MLACSSAGGGLRIAVVGNEELVTAEAGRRVALSSGGKVVTVRAVAQGHDLDLTEDAPDVVLLTGGTDGGNRELILRAARGLADSGWRGPTVVAGNVDARDEVSAILGDVPHVLADNVVPRIGVLAPGSARAAIREVFLSHVIGGKHLSKRADFTADGPGRDPGRRAHRRRAAGTRGRRGRGRRRRRRHHRRALGRRARPGAGRAGPRRGGAHPGHPHRRGRPRHALVRGLDRRRGRAAGARGGGPRRREDPGFLPTTDREHDEDEAIARAAVGLALRRHAGRSRVVVSPEGRVVERTGVDLREVDLVVGSGGVLRHGRDGVADRVLGPSIGRDGDWQLPERARVVVDSDYVLAAAGLLAAEHPDAAYRLVTSLLDGSWID